MARKTNGVNKSEEIRMLYKANPKISAQEIISNLAARGIEVSDALVYFVKGRLRGQRGRRKKSRQMVARVAATGNGDPVRTILKVKSWANEVGGMKKLRALVDALAE